MQTDRRMGIVCQQMNGPCTEPARQQPGTVRDRQHGDCTQSLYNTNNNLRNIQEDLYASRMHPKAGRSAVTSDTNIC